MEDKLNLLARTTLDSTLIIDPTRQWTLVQCRLIHTIFLCS
jgi:hypothetical protein